MERSESFSKETIARASLAGLAVLGMVACSGTGKESAPIPTDSAPITTGTTVPEIAREETRWGSAYVDAVVDATVDCESNDELGHFRPWYIGPGEAHSLVNGKQNPGDTIVQITEGWWVKASDDGTRYEVYGSTEKRRTTDIQEVEYTLVGIINHEVGETYAYTIGDVNMVLKPVEKLGDVRQKTEWGYFNGVYPVPSADPERPGLYAELHCAVPEASIEERL